MSGIIQGLLASYTSVSSSLTSANFTTSNADWWAVNWTWTQAQITDPNTSKSVFAKCNTTYNSWIVIAQAYLTRTNNSAAWNFWWLFLSSSDLVTSSQMQDQNYIGTITWRATGADDFRVRIRTTSAVYNVDNDTSWDRWTDAKIVYNTSDNTIKFYRWNWSAWTQMWTTQTYDIRQGWNLKFYITNVDVWDTNTFTFDNIYFNTYGADYSTHYPS